MRRIVLGIGLLSGCAMFSVSANQVTVACPKAIEVSNSLRNKVSGWQVLDSQTSHYWQSVTIYDGHPKDNASLVPNSAKDTESVWKFQGTRPIYAACGYYRSSLELYQALPQGVTACIVRYNASAKGEQGPIPESLVCQVGNKQERR